MRVTNELGHVIGDLARCESWQKVREMLTALKAKSMVSIIIIDYTAVMSCHVYHQLQFGNTKAHINKHTHVKSITAKLNIQR